MQMFDSVRQKLEKQYEHAVFDPESGLSEEELQEEFRKHCTENPGEPMILKRAFYLNLILRKARVAPDRENPFTGKFAGFSLIRKFYLSCAAKALEKEFGNMEETMAAAWERGIGFMVDTSHIAPDWTAVLKLGLPGLRSRAAQGTTPLHRAALLICDGAMELCRRLGKASGNPVIAVLAERAPETLHEAFQLAYLVHEIIEVEGEEVRSMGWFDRLYVDYYRRDLAAGRLTRESAKELIKYFWMAFYAKYQGTRFGKNFCFGPEINELSRLGMEAYYEMNIVDPKLSVRITPDTPEDFLALVAKNIRDGRTGIVCLNDDVVIRGLVKHGRSAEDAVNYIPIGCYEPAVLGHEISLSGATHLYLPQVLLHLLRRNAEYSSFEELMQAYLDELADSAREMARQQSRCEKIWKEIGPVAFLSSTFSDCLESGKDISAGGVKYNSTGCVVSYIADAVDSLAAIRYLVYEEKLCTLPELCQALRNDWRGYEKLQRIALTRPPKWGNNDPAAAPHRCASGRPQRRNAGFQKHGRLHLHGPQRDHLADEVRPENRHDKLPLRDLPRPDAASERRDRGRGNPEPCRRHPELPCGRRKRTPVQYI